MGNFYRMAASVLFLLLLAMPAHAALYAPGETLDPACAPLDADCGVSSVVGTGLQGQVPYYVSSTTLAATTTSAFRTLIGLSYATASDITQSTNIAAWGDSLTAGTGGTPYPTQLSTISGYVVYNGGVGGDTSIQIRSRMLADTSRHSLPTIIWAGRNNFTSPSQVRADIADMVAALGHDNYLVLGILNGNYANEYSGQPDYLTLTQLNSDLEATYGSHYIDMREYLVSQYNPTIPQDVTDHANDIVPSSLRSDSIHLNTAGYLKVAQYIYQNRDPLQSSGTSGVLTLSNIASVLASPGTIGNTAQGAGYFSQIGIGTTTPVAKLAIQALNGAYTSLSGNSIALVSQNVSGALVSIAGNGVADLINLNYGTTRRFTVTYDGMVGIGTSTPSAQLTVQAATGGAFTTLAGGSLGITSTNASAPIVSIVGTAAADLLRMTNSSSVNVFTVRNSGNVGISSSTPTYKLSVGGTVGFSGLTASVGSGSLCLTASKEVVYNAASDNCLSSTRETKHAIDSLALSELELLQKLRPVSFVYNGDPEERLRYGFIADEADAVDPHLATRDAMGKLSGLDTSGFLALIVGAVQELSERVTGFKDSFTTKDLNADRLCLGSTCVTEAELQQFLNQSNQQPAAPYVPPTEPEAPADPETPDEPEAEEPEAPAAPAQEPAVPSADPVPAEPAP